MPPERVETSRISEKSPLSDQGTGSSARRECVCPHMAAYTTKQKKERGKCVPPLPIPETLHLGKTQVWSFLKAEKILYVRSLLRGRRQDISHGKVTHIPEPCVFFFR